MAKNKSARGELVAVETGLIKFDKAFRALQAAERALPATDSINKVVNTTKGAEAIPGFWCLGAALLPRNYAGEYDAELVIGIDDGSCQTRFTPDDSSLKLS